MAYLKNHELIAALQALDPNAPVEFPLRQYNKSHPVAYIMVDSPTKASPLDSIAYLSHTGTVRITISLPDDMRTSTRTKK